MFRIEGNRNRFYQWDKNQRLRCKVGAGSAIHFSSPDVEKAIVMTAYEENGNVYADVPNLLLQKSGTFAVFYYRANGIEMHTEYAAVFKVYPRKMPDTYVYTETERQTWETLSDAAIKAVKEAIAEPRDSAANGDFNGEKGETGEKGKDGADGVPGRDGVNGKDGEDGAPGRDGADGYTPVRGVDYWTASDQQAIVAATLAALPDASEVSY